MISYIHIFLPNGQFKIYCALILSVEYVYGEDTFHTFVGSKYATFFQWNPVIKGKPIIGPDPGPNIFDIIQMDDYAHN
jgi:hypothetical protein